MVFFVAANEPDDALPRARVVLDLPLHPLRDRRSTVERLARGGAQVPDRRRLRLGVLLFGSALVYGATGELGFAEIARGAAQDLGDDSLLLAGLAMIIAGLGFKASAAPFHMWTPDVYEGAPTPVTAFMAAATKAAALVAHAARARRPRSRSEARPLDDRASP